MFNMLAVVALVLCVASILLWARARYYRDRFAVHTVSGRYFSICSMGGQIRCEVSAHFIPLRSVDFESSTDLSWGFNPAWLHWGGFAIGHQPWIFSSPGSGTTSYMAALVEFPLWTITLGLLASAWMMRRIVRKINRRVELGQCLRCGYDLRATPNRCPECGAVPEKIQKPS
jgi:hypothetical protein